MKHVIYGTALLAVAIMVIASVMIVSGRDVRENEMDRALNTAVEQTLEQLKKYGSYEIGDEQEMISDFEQALLMNISSDADIVVKILTADAEKGVLDVEITETYKTVNAKEKHAVCRKTVILEQYSDKKEYCMATFLVGGNVYDKYSLYPGSAVVIPREPKQYGSIFKGWKNADKGGWLTDGLVAEEDMTFYAVFE